MRCGIPAPQAGCPVWGAGNVALVRAHKQSITPSNTTAGEAMFCSLQTSLLASLLLTVCKEDEQCQRKWDDEHQSGRSYKPPGVIGVKGVAIKEDQNNPKH